MCPYMKSLIPEFLAFRYWRVVQFRGNRARSLKSLAQFLPELYSTQSYYHYLLTKISLKGEEKI